MTWESAVFLPLLFSTFCYAMDCKAVSQERVTTPTTFYKARVNASIEIRELKHFWESTGFCPPDPHQEFYKFMSTNDMAQNIAYIGSVPNKGIKQVRIHWLLDLMSMSKADDDGAREYSFTYLDKAMDLLLSNGLRPGFELMGNPSNYFTDFDDQKQIYAWRDLIKALGSHLIEQYGLEEVSQWNFESWNEPQDKWHFDGIKVSLQGYLNYYDACSEGLRLAHPALKLGGPGSGDPETHPIFYSLLDHCHNGRNFFTGEKGVRLDFISFHIKGEGHSKTILETELRVLTLIQQRFPKFAGIPVYNDEADPLVGWSREEEWRADARYAAMVVKIIAQHQNLLIPILKMKYSLLSNDNGFMGYPPSFFSQRTLLARFQMNTSHPRKAEFIKKPVLSVMGLLSILGDRQVLANVSMATDCFARNDDLGLIATTVHDHEYNNWELAVIVYNSNDTTNLTGLAVVNLNISGIPVVKDVLYVVYKIDNEHGNPYDTWKKMKSPVFPTENQFHELRLNQEPVRVTGPLPLPSEAHPGNFAFRLEVGLPGVALVHLCAKPLLPPSKVENISLLTVSSNEVFVYWKHSGARCIKTYQVLYSSTSEAGPYKVVNHVDIIFWAYHVVLEDDEDDRLTTPKGWFKVHAVDYWNRTGQGSKPVKWSCPG